MFSLFEKDTAYRFTFLRQHNRDGEYTCNAGTHIGGFDLGIYTGGRGNERIIRDMKDIRLHRPYYSLEYWRDEQHMAVMRQVTFLEIAADFCVIETVANEMNTVFRITALTY